nr:hypothetical protein L203_01318 [Cryptococcus depauperatus CBS 7841]
MLDIWKGWKLPYNLNIICGYKAFSYLVVSWVSGMSVWMIGFLADILDTEVGGLASYSYDPSTMQNASGIMPWMGTHRLLGYGLFIYVDEHGSIASSHPFFVVVEWESRRYGPRLGSA